MNFIFRIKSLLWIKAGPWNNQSIHHDLGGSFFEDFSITERKDRNPLMCAMRVHKTYKEKVLMILEVDVEGLFQLLLPQIT